MESGIGLCVLGYDPVTKNLNVILMDSRSFSVNSGQHNKQLCTSRRDCNTKLTFSFTLTKPNCLCYNGGTCTMEGGCNFPAGYGGSRCEHVRGRLRIYLQKGENLLNEMQYFSISDSDNFENQLLT